jgi:hypothetical protein
MDGRQPLVIAHRERLNRRKGRALRDANSRKKKIAGRVRRAETALARVSGKRLVAEMIRRRRMREGRQQHLRLFRCRQRTTRPSM